MWALQGQQGLIRQRHHAAAVADVLAEVRQISHLAAGIDDEQPMVGAARHHQVVEQATGGIGEEGITLFAHGQVDHVHRHQALQRLRRRVAQQLDLAHVRNIKQRRLVAAVAVLGEDAAGVVHRHVVARKRHHLGAEFAVQGVQRRGQQRVRHGGSPRAMVRPPAGGICPRCPLYLRDWPSGLVATGFAPSVGWRIALAGAGRPLSSEERPLTQTLCQSSLPERLELLPLRLRRLSQV